MRPTVAKINLQALRSNLAVVRSIVGADVGIIPVVKADAYGHGAVAVAWVLTEAGVDLMAVACIEEALDLVDAGVPARLILLGGVYDERSVVEVPPNCIPVVWDKKGIKLAASLPSASGRPVEVHVKVNTGMARLGCEPFDVPVLFEVARGYPHVRITGVLSHLASADETGPEDSSFTRKQIMDFHAVCKPIAMGILRHLAASAALIRYPDARFDAVRPGLMLYGIWPFDDDQPRGNVSPTDLKPVMSLVTKVLAIRDVDEEDSVGYGRSFIAKRRSRVAILPIGYADGLSRQLSNCGQVIIGGLRRKIVGRVSMDYITVDVTDAPEVNQGSEAVLIGEQGGEKITAWEMANWAGTIPYEITCGISRRVPRMVVDDYY